ncbi:hypothetical protein [Haloarchaeobius sp. DFWS5]|uniref:hypothetical protein n=1 Tax=Haloarchaeobius sp. DFWS5 TaxID=3446114 RepID=UPI003EC0A190
MHRRTALISAGTLLSASLAGCSALSGSGEETPPPPESDAEPVSLVPPAPEGWERRSKEDGIPGMKSDEAGKGTYANPEVLPFFLSILRWDTVEAAETYAEDIDRTGFLDARYAVRRENFLFVCQTAERASDADAKTLLSHCDSLTESVVESHDVMP